MSTAALIILGVLALLTGIIMTLRQSARTGMPSKEILDRATRRARDLEANERE